MPGIGAESVVPLNVNAGAMLQQAVAPSPDIVNPNAVAALTDAFRKGQISADDIIARYGDVAKTKDKAEIQGLSEFISPQAIEARKAATSLMGEKAKAEMSLMPAETAAKEAHAFQIRRDAELGDHGAMAKFAIMHGFGATLPSFEGGKAVTPEQKQKIESAYTSAVKYAAAVKGAIDIGKDVNRIPFEQTDENGQVTVDPNKDTLASKSSSINYTQEQAAKAHRLSMMTPEQFIAAGSPTVDEYVFGIEPKGNAEPSAPGVTPVNKLVTPAKTVTKKVTHPDGTVEETTTTIDSTEHPNPDASAVTPATPAAPAKPTLDVTGATLPPGAYVKKQAPTRKAGEEKMSEEAAKRVLTAQDFLNKADDALNIIETKPTVVGPGAFEGTGFARGVAKTGAFVGNESSRDKIEAQNKLDMFLAGSVQATIKSLAGSGNRVMQAEIADEKGLFNRAQPQLSSTPEVWKKWLGDVKKTYERAAAWEKGTLSPEESGRLDKILGTTGGAATATPAKPTGRSFTTPSGTTFVEDPKNPGSYILQKSVTAPAPVVPAPAPVVPGTMRRISDVGGNERI